MERTNHFVVLGCGKKVSWVEFSSWNGNKQKHSLNPSMLGKFWNEEMRTALSNKLKEKYSNEKNAFERSLRNGKSKKVMTPSGMFPSLNLCAKFFNVKKSKILSWIHDENNSDFYFINPISKIKLSARAVSTPEGRFETLTAAAKHYKVDQNTIKNWINGRGRLGGQLKFICSPRTNF